MPPPPPPPISFLTNAQYLIAFNTYRGSAEHPALTAPLPLFRTSFSLCVTTAETGNGKCLSKTLLCDSVSNREGVGGGGALLFKARCQRGMPKIVGVDNSQA